MRNLKIRIKNIILTGVMAAAVVIASSCNPGTENGAGVGKTASEAAVSPAGSEPNAGNTPNSSSSSEAESEDMTESDDRALLEEAEKLCGTYFKSGNMSYRLEIIPGDSRNRNQLAITFLKVELPGRSSALVSRLQFDFKEQRISAIGDSWGSLEPSDNPPYELHFYEDGRAELSGDSEAAGVYFPMEALFMPEVYERPLNQTDLLELDRDHLRILRNQYFAAYGREFKSQELQEYFEQQPWYQKSEDGERLAEANFTELDKRNLEFIKTAEANFHQEQWESNYKEYQQLPVAPYKELLPEHLEISVQITDFDQVKDRGLYYEAPGTISLPIVLSPQEYEAVMKESQEVEICVNELTGETATAGPSDEEWGEVAVKYQQQDWTDYCFLSYEPYSDCYSLWGDSDDTRFKKVYEGSIYVLKGAEEEWNQYFYMPLEERMLPQVLDFHKTENFEWESYSGNLPAFDEKGYIKGLYYFGD